MMQPGHAAPPDGVLALLRALRARVRPLDPQTSLRKLLPAYERLLRPDTTTGDREALMMRELQRVRDVLKSEPDLFDVAHTFDERVEACLRLDGVPRGENVWSMSDALRMLLALAGGDDGATFLLEDPTRVQFEAPSGHANAVSTRRLGERIQMSNVDIIAQAHHSLLRSAALPLETEAVLGQYDFASFLPKSEREATLWYPERSGQSGLFGDRNLSYLGALSAVESLFHQSKSGVPRIIDIPPVVPDSAPKKSIPTGSRRVNPSPSGIDTEVFFFDASKVIKSVDFSDHDGSETETSSKCDSDDQSAAAWSAVVNGTPLIASWEELGVEGSHSPELYSKKTDPLRQPLPLSMLRANCATSVVEVDEADLVECAAKALCGIESVVFQRDVEGARLRLPRKIVMKLPMAMPTSLMSILEEFRASGTAFLRIEYLSVYYAQDPSRGGKTCQSLADALMLYLSKYQRVIMDQIGVTGGHSYSVSLLATLSKTRAIRRQILALSRALKCSDDVGSDYWKLLSGGEFPRGIELLNLVQRELQECECEDVTGAMTLLWRWLLVRTAQPFVSLVSTYVASGRTPLELDPHNEFRLSVFSTLQGIEGDPVDTNIEDLMPHFLAGIGSKIIAVGKLQQLLCSILPKTDLLPVDGLHLTLRISEAQSQLDRIKLLVLELTKRVEAACNSDGSSIISRRPLRSPTKSPRSNDDGDDEWKAVKRKRLEDKRAAQIVQRELLDLSMREKSEKRFAQAEEERLADAETERAQLRDESLRLEHGEELLVSKYASLIADAEDQHRYMKWRRDRGVRFSSSKVELAELFEREQKQWLAAQAHSSAANVTQTLPEDQNPDQDHHADVVMVDAAPDSEGDRLTPCNPALNSISTDIIEDAGLLWRPTVRVKNVPGGGGQETMITLYPDRDRSPVPMTTHRSSVTITQPTRNEGVAAYESIYGGDLPSTSQSRQRNDEDCILEGLSTVRKSSTVSVTVGEITRSTAPITTADTDNREPSLPVPAMNDDVEMTTSEGDEAAETAPKIDCQAKPESTESTSERMVPEVSNESSNPALAILHSDTSFLRGDIPAEDTFVLRAVLHSDAALASALPTPFRSLSEIALTDPICVIHDFVDRMAFQAIVVKLKLKMHLLWLHRVALMSEGLCMSIFTRDLFNQLQSDMRVLLALPGRLTASLALAMIEARTATTTTQLPAFAYAIEKEFVSAVSSGPLIPSIADVVQNMTLTYGVSIHLSVVLTPGAMANYQRVHRFLLLMRLTEHQVKDTWLDWRKSRLRNGTPSDDTRRTCDLILHSAQFLLSAFLETFTNRVLESKWTEFMRGIDDASSVSWLRIAHEKFALEAMACCFLQNDQLEMLHVFYTLVECVWSLGKLIAAANTHGDSLDPFRLKLHDLAGAHATAMNTLATHLHGLESCYDRSLRDFTKHFLLRLNLNGFFADTTLVSPHS